MAKRKAIFDIIVKDDGGEWTKSLTAERISVGRLPECGLPINSTKVSRQHCSLFVKDDRIWIEDLGSANGTRMNGFTLRPNEPFALPAQASIELGKDGVWLKIESCLEGQADIRKNESVPLPLTPSTSTPPLENLMKADAKGEALLQEARVQAVRIVQQAQVEAEAKSVEIYRQAQETVEKAEKFYQEKMQAALVDSEKTYKETEKSNQDLLQLARNQAQEVRLGAETYARDLRKKAEDQSAAFLKETDERMRVLKEQRLSEVDQLVHEKEAQVLLEAQKKAESEIAKTREAFEAEAAGWRERMAAELKLHQDQIEVINADLQSLGADHRRKVAELQSLDDEMKKQWTVLRELDEKVKASTASVTDLEKRAGEAQQTRDKLTAEAGSLSAEVQKKREESALVSGSLAKLNREFEEAHESQEKRLLQMREKYDEDFRRMEKEEEERVHNLSLESTRRAQKFEEDIFVEIADKKKKIGREILLTIEAGLKEQPDSKKNLSLTPFEKTVFGILEGAGTSAVKDSVAEGKRKQLLSARRKDRFVLLGSGIMTGALLFFAGQLVYTQVIDQTSPWKQQVMRSIAEDRRELEQRRFNPPQDAKVRDTYADSVIYTQGFSDIYVNDQFQEKWSKAATKYLFKTWRLDEQKSIEALSLARALVKGLIEQRQNIHPDFVPQGIEKMQVLEKDQVARLKEILGSQVRYESLKKFEKQYFEEHARDEGNRATASTPEAPGK